MNRCSALTFGLLAGLAAAPGTARGGNRGPDSVYTFARRQVEAVRRRKPSQMPAWLKKNRDAYRDRLVAAARKAYEQTGIWFLARGASRITDEQETVAVWGDLLTFYGGDVTLLPEYSKEHRQQAIAFWQSWQNLETGLLYNPLYQDPQNPAVKRHTPGNRGDYSPGGINTKYIPVILGMLGSTLALPVNTATRVSAIKKPTRATPSAREKAKDKSAGSGKPGAVASVAPDPFDRLWDHMSRWENSPAGALAIAPAHEVANGRLDRIPQAEAGMGALVRAYHPDTGMWRPEPLQNFPWNAYNPSSGFKIIARICGYIGMENFPEPILKTAIDNLLAHKNELYAQPATARNYGETMAHFLMLTDYRHDELLDAMELCLQGFRDPKAWENTGTGSYCIFGHAFIGAFMNWSDLPYDQAMPQYFRFEHGCRLPWRFVAGPYGNWVNAIPKKPEEVFGNPGYDVRKYGLRARNRAHWAKNVTEVIAQQDVALKIAASGKTGQGSWTFTLTPEQLAKLHAPYFKATWSGAFDVFLNGEPVKNVRYNLPHDPAGWYISAKAATTLHVGENTITANLLGPGKEPRPGAPLATRKPFLRLGLIAWQ